MARMLCGDPLLARAVNKSYVVRPGPLLEGNLSTKEGCDEFAKMLFDATCENEDVVKSLRMQVFRPKYQSRLLLSLDALINENETKDDDSDPSKRQQQFTIAPKGFSHMLSVVEVYEYKGRGCEQQRQKEDDNRRYMIGISRASLELDVVDTNNIIGEDGDGDDVSRAYYKLKEAVETYTATRGKLQGELYDGSIIAVDGGSAPGGWTKYLIEHFNCDTVHSVDPGLLAPSVLDLKGTNHMQMKIQDAMPLLLKDESSAGRIGIWVSDMCLHYVVEQVDQLLSAREMGLLAPNAFFVLTLKCTVGHSKRSFDSQVQKVVDKLCGAAEVSGLETLHLFSNRSGERTVIGYIN